MSVDYWIVFSALPHYNVTNIIFRGDDAMKPKAFLNWSGGKDCALALYEVQKQGQLDVTALFTLLKADGCVPMHQIHKHLVQRQAESIGIPLILYEYSTTASLDEQKQTMAAAMEELYRKGMHTAIYGDISLENVRQMREKNLRQSAMRAEFPLWKRTPQELFELWTQAGMKAVVTSVNGAILERDLVGRLVDRSFWNALPPYADPWGENGEYHSFAFDGPIFRTPVPYQLGHIQQWRWQDSHSQQRSFFWYRPVR